MEPKLLTSEEIVKLELSIEKAKKTLQDDLIMDPEARATLYSIICYYQAQIKKQRDCT